MINLETELKKIEELRSEKISDLKQRILNGESSGDMDKDLLFTSDLCYSADNVSILKKVSSKLKNISSNHVLIIRLEKEAKPWGFYGLTKQDEFKTTVYFTVAEDEIKYDLENSKIIIPSTKYLTYDDSEPEMSTFDTYCSCSTSTGTVTYDDIDTYKKKWAEHDGEIDLAINPSTPDSIPLLCFTERLILDHDDIKSPRKSFQILVGDEVENYYENRLKLIEKGFIKLGKYPKDLMEKSSELFLEKTRNLVTELINSKKDLQIKRSLMKCKFYDLHKEEMEVELPQMGMEIKLPGYISNLIKKHNR